MTSKQSFEAPLATPIDTVGASTLRVDEIDYNMLSSIYEHTKNNSRMLSAILSKLNELSEEKVVEDKEEQKKKLDEIFEKKGVGRPSGSFEERQQQYFKLVKSGKIKSPVAKTLEYYNIKKDDRGEYLINLLPK